MPYITSIATQEAPYQHRQERIGVFMQEALADEVAQRKLRLLFKASGISNRYSVLPDFSEKSYVDSFFLEQKNPSSTAKRMKLYEHEAAPMALKAVQKCLAKEQEYDAHSITHIITVTCTGLYAPGLDYDLITQLGLKDNVTRYNIHFMGCYAAFNGVRLANTICAADEKARVLVVCVELCSIHYQNRPEDDFLLSNTLFGDGAGAVCISASPTRGKNFEITSSDSRLLPDSQKEMAWHIGNEGFEMRLSTYVPQLLRQHLPSILHPFLDEQTSPQQNFKLAIHPGGKRILDEIRKVLHLPEEQLKESYDTLAQYGNMSSATILFIWEKLWHKPQPEGYLSLAFGPGLTVESVTFKPHWKGV